MLTTVVLTVIKYLCFTYLKREHSSHLDSVKHVFIPIIYYKQQEFF